MRKINERRINNKKGCIFTKLKKKRKEKRKRKSDLKASESDAVYGNLLGMISSFGFSISKGFELY